MIRLWLVFFLLFALFFFGIPAYQKLTGLAKWNLTKTAFFSIICSLLAVATMTLIVILF
jgi:hypothetical protein